MRCATCGSPCGYAGKEIEVIGCTLWSKRKGTKVGGSEENYILNEGVDIGRRPEGSGGEDRKYTEEARRDAS